MVITILKPYFTGFISFINQILNDIKTFIFNKQPPPPQKKAKNILTQQNKDKVTKRNLNYKM